MLNNVSGIWTPDPIQRTEATIHTHDRIAFKRCRRKWLLSSPLGRNLEPSSADKKLPLWFGSGFHFALEDYHGYRKFGYPEEAFEAYVVSFPEAELPIKAEESIPIGLGMLGYYQKWLRRRDNYRTLWIDGEPQVEVGFDLELTELSQDYGYPVYYHGTFDRVVVDDYDRWWIEDYKSVADIDLFKLQTDPQISSYIWAGEYRYQHAIEGILYTQFVKDIPKEPVRLSRKDGFSKDKRQRTTHTIYRDALIREYGKVPQEYIEFLNDMAAQESIEGDSFIRRDTVYRTPAEIDSTYKHIIAETRDMLTPDIACYPNPTKDCTWDCPFRQVCIAIDDGSDYEDMLEAGFSLRNETAKGQEPEWRKRIKWPQKGGE